MPLVRVFWNNLQTKVQISSSGFYAAPYNLKVKDTLKRQKTLHTGKMMREFEEIRESLMHGAAVLLSKTGEKILSY
jgi:hypothetical protein